MAKAGEIANIDAMPDEVKYVRAVLTYIRYEAMRHNRVGRLNMRKYMLKEFYFAVCMWKEVRALYDKDNYEGRVESGAIDGMESEVSSFHGDFGVSCNSAAPSV